MQNVQLYFAALKEQEVEKERDENDSQDSHFDSSYVRTHALAGLLFILVSLRRCLQLIMHSAKQILTVLCLKIFNAR